MFPLTTYDIIALKMEAVSTSETSVNVYPNNRTVMISYFNSYYYYYMNYHDAVVLYNTTFLLYSFSFSGLAAHC
jgi:hypothetical protein